jgi:aminopeptidase N
METMRFRQALAAVALFIAWLGIAGAVVEPPESINPRPWELDPIPEEAARKIAFYERMTQLERWSEQPTANQLLLDARYYDLGLALDPVTQRIAGTLTARFEVHGPQASVLDLDLAVTLAVSNVTVGGTPATFTHAQDILAINLNRTYFQGETVVISLAYSGVPDGTYGAFGFESHNGQPMIWTLSEPFGARSWWPCEDWSDDKADSVDLHITVPAGLIVASNGKLRAVTHNGATDTFWWHEGNPIATYLVSLAAHPYTVTTDYYVYSPTDSMEIAFYDYPDHAAGNAPVNMMIKDMIAEYATLFGEYPFLSEKYGHAEFNWGGGMEHQTCTSLGAYYESIVAHELSHQWWGDMVTCADFHHVWLNEGFARYCEALWFGHAYGPEGYWGRMNAIRYYGPGTIYVPDLSDWNRIFDGNLSYNKAAWVVHMLRGVLGDEDFFEFLLAYRAAYEYGSTTTEGLQAIAESISGLDLTGFFQQWIYGEYYPTYGYTWEVVDLGGAYELHLTIDQLQTLTGLFHMPIRMRAELEGGGTFDFTVDNSLASQQYVVAVPAPIASLQLDPEDWILKRLQEPVVDPTFAEGTLLVNGVDWGSYGTELRSAYQDRAFWGNLAISFWDCFAEPAGGYPSTLPAPLGHGRVPASQLGRFANVIWVGNNLNGDLACWLNTSIQPYVEAGGNVLLMTRNGESFLEQPMRTYLGITGVIEGRTLYDCISVHSELTNIGRIGTQSLCITFDPTLAQPTSTLLYVADQGYNPNPGIGVLRAPTQGGTYNPYGGRFAFLSGRPYRWNHANLATNVETIVTSLMGGAADVGGEPIANGVHLSLRLPNPALGAVRVTFQLPQATGVQLSVFDSQGRRLHVLTDATWPAGEHALTWNGRSDRGLAAPAGIYYVRLQAGEASLSRPLLLLR